METAKTSDSPSPSPAAQAVTGTEIASAVADLHEGLRKWRMSAWLGWQDAILPFRRTFIGPFWVSIQTGLWVAIIVTFLGPWLGEQMPRYPLYVAVGIVAFQFMTTMLVDGAGAFTRNAGLIKNIPNPLSIYLLRIMFKALILLFAQAPVIIIAAFFTPSGVPITAVMALFGVALSTWTLMGIYLVLATITPRFRDVPYGLNALMRVMMFVTPIFWLADMRSSVRAVAVHYNPLAHMLNVIREPFLGNPPPQASILVCLGLGAACWLVGFILFSRNRSLIAAQL